MSIERYGIINDSHIPFHDKARYKTAFKIFEAAKISHLYLNGDICEFLAVSTHAKHPAEKIQFGKEIVLANEEFDKIQTRFPDMPVTYICGNHEGRFFRYVRDLAPEMWGLIDCPKLFNFPDRPYWKFVDYGPDQLVRCGKSNLYLRHEPLGGGVSHAKATAENSVCDLAYGHTHTFQTYSHKKFGPKRITTKAYSLGWLGDSSKSVFDYRGPRDRWVHGCTIVEADIKTGEYLVDFICLDKLPVLYRGVKFDAR